MKRPANYRTKQREAILDYIASRPETHVTAAQIIAHFESGSLLIGRTTVYRLLDKLTGNGTIRKYAIDGIQGACFQYADTKDACREHLHLKCEDCGGLLHLRCETMNEMQKHILNEHSFRVNVMKTILYGKCEQCLRKA